jgi:EAL domain-containing protein (putative c-di-GMP-specific phosphodiesterase class I)
VIDSSEIALLDGLERALINKRLHMVYQPKVGLADGRVKRVEALVRWDDEKAGVVAPSRFVPLAEKHGLIDELTQWGLRTTLRQWRAWHAQGLEIGVAFNISALSLQHLDFPDLVERMCRALEVPTSCLVLELTEGATQPLVKLMDTLTRFRIKGIGLAMDDFGVGYSSLVQLRQLPFTEIKIDRLFVTDLPQASESKAIVEAIVGLGHGLGLEVTAEGVENEAQFEALRAIGCDVAQGYFVCEPLEPETLAKWCDRWAERWEKMVNPSRARAGVKSRTARQAVRI